MSVAWVGVAATVAGAAVSAKSAGDASDAQSEAAANSDATQRYQYDTTRADNKPFLANGTAASNRLAELMGLDVGPQANAQGNFSAEAYLAANPDIAADPYWSAHPFEHFQQFGVNEKRMVSQTGSAPQTVTAANFDPKAYLAANPDVAADPYFAANPLEHFQRYGSNEGRQENLPTYGGWQAPEKRSDAGSLTRRFSAADLNADPVYQSGLQFGLNEGTKGINRQAAANGSFLSGATLKALTRFGNDYGSTKANESYNRFNNDQTQQYNRLAGIAGSGQTASNQVGASGMNMANNISQSQQGVGNARASGYLVQGNALQNGLNGAVSAYRNGGTNSLAPSYYGDLGGGGGNYNYGGGF